MQSVIIRTSYAGVANNERDLDKSYDIMQACGGTTGYITDKSVEVLVPDAEKFRRMHREARIDYLIDSSSR